MPVDPIDLNPMLAEYGLPGLVLGALAWAFWKMYSHSRQDRKDADTLFYAEREKFAAELRADREAHKQSLDKVSDSLDSLKDAIRSIK